jgi:hypothetical protein
MSLTDRFQPPATKVCTSCKADKPIKEFCRTTKSPDGYNWSCRACKKEREEEKKSQRKKYSKTFFDEREF